MNNVRTVQPKLPSTPPMSADEMGPDAGLFLIKRMRGLNQAWFLLMLVLVAGFFWKPLARILALSVTDGYEHYSHIVLMPFLSGYMLYLRRDLILAAAERSLGVGLAVTGIGVALFLSFTDPSDAALEGLSVQIFSFLLVLWGIFVLCFGWRGFRVAFFGLSLLVFMVPVPPILFTAVVSFLQYSSAEAANLLFTALAIPVFREGYIFTLSSITIHVAEECSGIRSTLSLFTVSLVAGHLFLRSFWAQLGIASIVIPLAIIKNAFRIVGLALLANYVDPSFITDSALHRNGGIPLFLLSLAVLFVLVWLLRRCEERIYHYSTHGSRTKT